MKNTEEQNLTESLEETEKEQILTKKVAETLKVEEIKTTEVDKDNVEKVEKEQILQNDNSEDIKSKTLESVENSTEGTNENATKNKAKTLTFWITLICGFIIVVQFVLNYFSIQFETKIIVEIISFVLAFLASMGVLGSSLKGKNITEVKEQIEKTISSQLKNYSTKDKEENDKTNSKK